MVPRRHLRPNRGKPAETAGTIDGSNTKSSMEDGQCSNWWKNSHPVR